MSEYSLILGYKRNWRRHSSDVCVISRDIPAK